MNEDVKAFLIGCLKTVGAAAITGGLTALVQYLQSNDLAQHFGGPLVASLLGGALLHFKSPTKG